MSTRTSHYPGCPAEGGGACDCAEQDTSIVDDLVPDLAALLQQAQAQGLIKKQLAYQ